MSAPEPRLVVDARNQLGEGPVWDERRGALLWVDIREPALWAYRPAGGGVKRWLLPEMIGSFALCRDDDMVLALRTGFARFEPDSRKLTPLVAPEPERPDNRFNDGKCDRAGRFWAGTMSTVAREPTGALYRLDPVLACTRVLSGITIPNSLAWSPDDRWLYFADSWRRTIQTYPFDLASGQLGTPGVFADLTDRAGVPDGSTVDASGCLWNAEYGGGRVVRYTPDGRVDRVVRLPVSQVTSCAFGGPSLTTLFITTARQNLTEGQLAAEPLAGGLFAIELDVAGLPEPRFGGLPGS